MHLVYRLRLSVSFSHARSLPNMFSARLTTKWSMMTAIPLSADPPAAKQRSAVCVGQWKSLLTHTKLLILLMQFRLNLLCTHKHCTTTTGMNNTKKKIWKTATLPQRRWNTLADIELGSASIQKISSYQIFWYDRAWRYAGSIVKFVIALIYLNIFKTVKLSI